MDMTIEDRIMELQGLNMLKHTREIETQMREHLKAVQVYIGEQNDIIIMAATNAVAEFLEDD